MNTLDEVIEGKGRWTLINAKCEDVVPSLKPSSVDHVICDPPYTEATHDKARSIGEGQPRFNSGHRTEKPLARNIDINFEALTTVDPVVQLLLPVSRRWVLCFCELEMLGDYRRAAGDLYVRGGVWDRPNGTPQLSGDRPGQAAEGIALMHRAGRKKWNGGGKRGKWSHGVERDGRIHPTQKPIELMLELIRDFTDPDDLVLDPFAGGGTTGAACIQLGRRFIGVEMDATYYAAALARLEKEVEGLVIRKEKFKQATLL